MDGNTSIVLENNDIASYPHMCQLSDRVVWVDPLNTSFATSHTPSLCPSIFICPSYVYTVITVPP